MENHPTRTVSEHLNQDLPFGTCFQFHKTSFLENQPSAIDTHTHTQRNTKTRKKEQKIAQTGAPLPASGSEAGCSLLEGLEGTPAWLELHSVLRGKEPAKEQEKYIKNERIKRLIPKDRN